MSDKKLGAKLPNSLIKKDNVTIFPEGAIRMWTHIFRCR